jgi:hypothetical protein
MGVPDIGISLLFCDGAQEKTRTSTTLRPLAPEASASTNSATWARLCQAKEIANGLQIRENSRNPVGVKPF